MIPEQHYPHLWKYKWNFELSFIIFILVCNWGFRSPYLVGIGHQLLQGLHPLRDPLPPAPELQSGDHGTIGAAGLQVRP